jgi:hypothetical protein
LEIFCVVACLKVKTLDMCSLLVINRAPEEPIISLKRLGLGGKKSETDTMLEMVAQQQAARDKEAAASTQAATPSAAPGAAKKPPPAAGGLGAFKQPVHFQQTPNSLVDSIQARLETILGNCLQEIPGIREEAGQARARRFEQESA